MQQFRGPWPQQSLADIPEYWQMCEHRSSWLEQLGRTQLADSDPSSAYDDVVHNVVASANWRRINIALQYLVTSRSKRRGSSGAVAPSQEEIELVVPLPFQRFDNPAGRDRLRRALRVTAQWDAELGYEPRLTRFISMIMVVLETERPTFKAVMHMFGRYRLREMYVISSRAKESSIVHFEALDAWFDLDYMCPEASEAFQKHGQVQLFNDLVEDWIATLFANTFDHTKQHFGSLIPFLEYLLAFDYDLNEDDPRRRLRHVAASILTHNVARLRDASLAGPIQFEELVAELRNHVVIDDGLMDLLRKPRPLAARLFGHNGVRVGIVTRDAVSALKEEAEDSGFVGAVADTVGKVKNNDTVKYIMDLLPDAHSFFTDASDAGAGTTAPANNAAQSGAEVASNFCTYAFDELRGAYWDTSLRAKTSTQDSFEAALNSFRSVVRERRSMRQASSVAGN